jgi:hypothetical protein
MKTMAKLSAKEDKLMIITMQVHGIRFKQKNFRLAAIDLIPVCPPPVITSFRFSKTVGTATFGATPAIATSIASYVSLASITGAHPTELWVFYSCRVPYFTDSTIEPV